MLFSISDNPFLVRNGELHTTPYFIDSGSTHARIMLCLFTPEVGVASVLEIEADFTLPHTPIKVKTLLSHYAILEGTRLSLYVFVQALNIFNVVVLLFYIVQDLIGMVAKYREDGERPTSSHIVAMLFDSSSTLLITVFVIVRVWTRWNSAANTANVLSMLSALPWGDDAMEIKDKKSRFFEALDQLLGLIEQEKSLTTLCLVILLISLVRIISSMDCHPRLALLTSTLYNALDDLRHSMIIILLLMSAFACISAWRFGEKFDYFADFGTSFFTNFTMLFGDFPEGWTSDPELVVFVIVYFIILFLLVQVTMLIACVRAGIFHISFSAPRGLSPDSMRMIMFRAAFLVLDFICLVASMSCLCITAMLTPGLMGNVRWQLLRDDCLLQPARTSC